MKKKFCSGSLQINNIELIRNHCEAERIAMNTFIFLVIIVDV